MQLRLSLVSFVGLAVLSGCGGGGGGNATGEVPADPIDVALAFEARVGDAAFDCKATHPGLGTAGTEASITDFRLYVHDVRLRRADGTEVPVELEQDGLWQHQDLALLDFEDRTGACANGTPETNATLHGTAERGTYDGLSFKVGVPFELNHGDAAAAPSPLNLSAMFWSWNGGYKFFRADALPAGSMTAFNVHIGSLGCQADAGGKVTACAMPNRAEITLTGFDPLAEKVIIDYAALVAGTDLSKDTGGAPGCMSGPDDPECVTIFERLGIDIKDGTLHPDAQTLFRVE